MCYPQLLTKRWSDVLLTGYLVILTFAGFIDGVALSFTPKPDATAISFIAFLDGLTAIVHKLCARNTQKLDPCATPALLQHQIVGTQTPPSVSKHPLRGLETDITSTERILPEARSTTNRHQSRLRRCGYATLKVCNRVLMGLHTIFVILSIFGTIELALTYRYTNPYVNYLIGLAKWSKKLTKIVGLWLRSRSRLVKCIKSTTTVLQSNRLILLCRLFGSKAVLHTVLLTSWDFKHPSHSITVAIHAHMIHRTLDGLTLFQ